MWTATRPPKAGILLFDDVEVLDFAGPYEVLTAARDAAGTRRVEVLTLAERQEVVCTGGLRVLPDVILAECPELDVLIVPGGGGAREKRPQVQEAPLSFIRDRSSHSTLLASVCTGAFLLGRAGLLDGKRATTHTRRLELFRAEFPRVEVVIEKIVDLGDVLTAGGVFRRRPLTSPD